MPLLEQGCWPRRDDSRDPEVARGTARCIGMDAVAMLATAVVERHSQSTRTHSLIQPDQPSERSAQVQQLTFSMLSESVDTLNH